MVFGGVAGVCALSEADAPANDATNTIAFVSFIVGLPGMTGDELEGAAKSWTLVPREEFPFSG